MTQRDEKWFQDRAGKFTGSRVSVIASGNSTAGRTKLLWTLAGERLMNNCAPTYCNSAMERGTELEPYAREAYEMERLCVVEEVDFIQHIRYPFVGVSPDGLVGAEGAIEIKVPDVTSLHIHLQHIAKGYYAKQYRWQVQHLLWVADRQWCDVISYHPEYERQPLGIIRVERDEKAIKTLEDQCAAANDEVNEILKQLEAA